MCCSIACCFFPNFLTTSGYLGLGLDSLSTALAECKVPEAIRKIDQCANILSKANVKWLDNASGVLIHTILVGSLICDS